MQSPFDSPLSGFRSPFGYGRRLGGALAAYAVATFTPKLVFDFETETYATGGAVSTFDDSITFARSSTATMVNSSGALVEVASGVPRRGHHVYDGTSYVNEGLLVESEARTNLDPNSDDLSAWTIIDTAIVKDETGADGVTASAHSIEATAANGTALEQITAAEADYVWSCLMKRVTGTGTIETTVDGGTTWVDVTSDINADEFIQVGTGAGITVTDPEFGVRIGTSGDKVAVQVSQLEQTSGQFSSPIPTSGASITRDEETLTVPAAKLPYSSTNMSIQIEGRMTYADTGSAFEVQTINWSDLDGYIRARMSTTSGRTGAWSFERPTGSVGDPFPGTYLPGILVPLNLASRHGSTFVNGAIGGTALTADTTPTALPDLSATDLDLAPTYMGTLRTFRMWPEDLGDDGIEDASA